MNSRACLAPLCAFLLAVLCAVPATASAVLTIEPGSATLELLNATGEPEVRAGAHPDRLIQSFRFEESGDPLEQLRDARVDLPAGLSGDADAVPPCPRWKIRFFFGEGCPVESQVGVLRDGERQTPLYSVERGPNEAAVFVARAILPLTFVGQLRADDFGLSLLQGDISSNPLISFEEATVELWGVPADHQQETETPRKAFLTMPTRCDGHPLGATVALRSWQRPDHWITSFADTGHSLTGCDQLPFDPSVAFSLEDPRVDAPTGVRIDLTIPQNEDPDGRAASQVASASIVLPEGMTLAPGSAAGLDSCSDAQLGIGDATEPSCPAASRVGSIEMHGPGLDATKGSIYLGRERPGERFRLFMAASAKGSELKFAGSLRADPRTGRLTADLDRLPPVSFERLTMRFEGGPGALLATPIDCGPAAATAQIAPNSGGPVVKWAGAVGVGGAGGGPCAGPAGFAPRFTGGSTSARAGRPTGFTATIRREDGEQLPARLEISLPPGVGAALGRVEPCLEAAVAKTGCGPGSDVGDAFAELGPGATPARLDGDIFLTGPYRRAPFGVAIVFKAAIGPFDLGTFTVRGALRVDPLSGRVTVVTDALPSIVEGMPIRFQTLGLDFDRAGFIRNPTSCAPAKVSASLRSDRGATAEVSAPFRVRDCVGLPFHPAFSLALTEPAELHRHGRPGLRIRARVPAGNANLRTVGIALPAQLRLDSSGLREICARGAALEGRCPARSRVGTAFARTPLLKGPLRGSIYVVQPRGTGSPDLWTSLDGSGVHVDLQGETAAADGRAETRLVGLPDFSLTSFTMQLAGGERGLFALDGSPCADLVASLSLRAQNGAGRKARARVATPGGCGRRG